MTNDAFKAQVLTHLEYIKKKQDDHDKKLSDLNLFFAKQTKSCEIRFSDIEREQTKFTSFIIMAIMIGSAVGSIITLVIQYIRR